MSKENRFISIRTKFFLILIAALVVSAIIFGAFREFGNFLVWRYYLDEESKAERSQGYIAEFQDYVTANKLSVNDSVKISDWSGGSYVDILIYKDSNLMYAPDWFVDVESDTEQEGSPDDENVESETDQESESVEENEGTEGESESESESSTKEVSKNNGWFSGDRGFEQYLTQEAKESYLARLSDIMSGNQELKPVYFVDGTALVTVVDYSEEFMDNLVIATALISSILAFVIIMLIVFSSTVTRIKRLAQKVRRVERGELETAIKLEGNDEITHLAADVNSMKNAVIENMSKEQKAWEANTELITAMSHDIRTPLTVMLGYLDLVEMQNGDESIAEYIDACKENALRLKRLSDDMFSYFLVFGKREVSIDLSKTYKIELVAHMIAEKIFWLEEKGYVVNSDGMANIEGNICIDTHYFGRVIDNVFSNIEKYADASGELKVSYFADGDSVRISFINKVRADSADAESNGIGTKTCKRIMEKLGGDFEHYEKDGLYVAEITLPLISD